MVSKHNITEFPPAHKLKPLANRRVGALLFFKRCHPSEASFADEGPASVVRNSLDKPQTHDLKRTYPTHDYLCVSSTILPRYE
jgi:hypothetical protein